MIRQHPRLPAYACVYLIQLDFIRLLHGLAPDIPLGRGPRKRPRGNDNDQVRRGDPLMQIPPRMEVPRLPDDLLLQLLTVHLDCGLDEDGRGGSAETDDDAGCDEGRAHRHSVVFDGSIKMGQ